MDKQATVLIVDDEPINIKVIANILEDKYQLTIATNGETALEIVNSVKPNLILLDINMPHMDGYEVAKILKANKKTKNIPFIFLTAKQDSESIVKGFELGAVDYIPKPFNNSELLARVENHIKTYILQQDILKQKEEYETIFKYAQDGIAKIDLEGNFICFNKAFLELTGYNKDQLMTKNCNDLTAVEHKEKNELAIKTAIEKGKIENFEKDCIVNDGKRVTINTSIALLPDKKSLLLLSKNRTFLKLLEEQKKLTSINDMIRNISHQWRQPLSTISTCATGMELEQELGTLDDEKIINNCQMINKTAQYLSKIIEDFNSFIKGDSKPVRFDLKNDTDSFIRLVETTIREHNIQVILDLEEHLEIKGYPNELIECFINIFNNSKEAFLDNNINKEERYIFISQHIKDHKVIIKFRDNAGGIPQNIIDKIFEPYFTTKHQSQGRGLGLHIVYSLITNDMTGEIKVENLEYDFNGKNYKGANFNIELPIS